MVRERRPPRALRAFVAGATVLATAGTVTASFVGCGPGAGGAAEDPGYTTNARDTVPQTAPRPTDGDDTLVGTGAGDVIRAGDGDDTVRGAGGDDEIRGGEGKDRLYGGPGDDVVDAQDARSRGAGGRDAVFCGPGRDEVLMDAGDGEKPKGCEAAGVGSS